MEEQRLKRVIEEGGAENVESGFESPWCNDREEHGPADEGRRGEARHEREERRWWKWEQAQ
jgi:hypothetical protein